MSHVLFIHLETPSAAENPMVSKTRFLVSPAHPARSAPPLCCGTAAAYGLGLRLLAFGVSVEELHPPSLFPTAKIQRFARAPGPHPTPCGGCGPGRHGRQDFRGGDPPENCQKGGLNPNNWQSGIPGRWPSKGALMALAAGSPGSRTGEGVHGPAAASS